RQRQLAEHRRRWPGAAGVVHRTGGCRDHAGTRRQADDFHRRLLQRTRPCGRPRRYHSRPERRGCRSIRRADARRVRRKRAAPRLAVRRRLEQRPDRSADHSAPGPSTRPAETAAIQQADLMQRPLVPWTLSFLRPYRRRVALLSVLLLLEIGLGALQPWPLKIVIDYVLGSHPLPPTLAGWLTR